jgi:hypothetical protein
VAPASGETFEICLNYTTDFGQEIFAVGSSSEFGEWDAAKGLKLAWSEGDNWRASLPISALDKKVEYKYVVVGEGSRWEAGENRAVDVDVAKTANYAIQDVWQI